MFLSIIIPVYNSEKTINRCLESIISQKGNDFEILVIDDGSTDSSYELCLNITKKDERIKLEKQDNQGVSSARNHGLRIARGKYISFVDSDDWVSDNYIDTIRKEAVGNSDVIFWGISICDDFRIYNEKRLDEYKGNIIEDILFNLWEKNLYGIVCSKAVKREIINRNKIYFDCNINIREDQDFIMKCWPYIKNLSLINDILYYYYQNPTSITHNYLTENNINDFKKRLEDLEKNCLNIVFFMNNNGINKLKVDNYCKNYYISTMEEIVLSLLLMKEKKKKILKYQFCVQSVICEKYKKYVGKIKKKKIIDYLILFLIKRNNKNLFLVISWLYQKYKKIKMKGM